MSDLAASPLPELPAPERNPIFFGPDGLRAGWGILLFALLLGILYMVIDAATQIQHLIHPAAEYLKSPFFTPKVQLAEAVFYMLAVVFAAILLGRGLDFPNGKAILTLILLLVSLFLITNAIVHVIHLQHERAAAQAAQGKTPAKQSPPSSAPAANSTQQELTAAGSEALTFAIVLLVTWIMSRVEHRPFGQYGLGGNARRWPQFAKGLFSGFAALSLLILGLYLGHWISFNGFLLKSPGAILSNGMLWLLAFLMVGFFEEFMFRGYLQFTLARGIGFGAIGFFIAAAVFNFSFGFVHGSNPGESPIGLFTAGLIGFVFCISLWYTRSLWWAIGFHATWDWGESYFYGTADSGGVSQGRLIDTHPQGKLLLSGGATGPEGSALCLLVIVLIAIWVWYSLRNERNKSTNQALVNPLDTTQAPLLDA
jgi:membrane protease YdiL (CAAX protease family)